MKKYSIGRNDCKPMNRVISGIGKVCKVRRFKTLKQAVKFQKHLALNDREGLIMGKYFLDGPADQ